MSSTYTPVPGDVVTLKSGGPPMTVFIVHDQEKRGTNPTHVNVVCTWFLDGHVRLETFEKSQLQKAE